jgi:ABC-2 type transport system permease protein
MNTQSNVMNGSSFDSQAMAPAAISQLRLTYWSIRREFWENRALYLAPLGIAGVFLFGFLISTVHLPDKVRSLEGLDAAQYREAMGMPYDFAAGLMMLTGILVSVFYCIDALYGERRDRSILFWKSLPVSDLTTVLAKASIPLVILPLLTFGIGITMHWIMLLVSSVVLLGSGLNIAMLWTQVSFFQMSFLLLYHILTAHALWPAPVYCWLLLVSGWARRAPLLWAALPVVAIAGVEGIIFRTTHFAALVGSRLIGNAPAVAFTPSGGFPSNPMTHITPAHFLATPGLWMGLVISVAFLAAAVRLRRYQGPI